MEELRIDASMENVDRLISILDERLEAVDCPMKTQLQLDVAVEEVFGNICQYAYGQAPGEAIVRMNITEQEANITFIDEGAPFNPLEKEEPDVEMEAMSENVGGLGIFMVKESMDAVTYEYNDGKNHLTIVKYLM
ncbi:ATP-binding protein [Pseudobutyrivibrio sp.]|uniref:ATP-binding protein n=1 Tax=Pseudobutyrivibrio sp. TaxID=2014367 RepID=UPI001D92929D|nr:ATP-binding protein [Pseudobutyrivibrio sp.]MBE5910464.1 ATP-binding protein [Pseudobutyrivibrio sp.]